MDRLMNDELLHPLLPSYPFSRQCLRVQATHEQSARVSVMSLPNVHAQQISHKLKERTKERIMGIVTKQKNK
jgi:hypothetical protein